MPQKDGFLTVVPIKPITNHPFRGIKVTFSPSRKFTVTGLYISILVPPDPKKVTILPHFGGAKTDLAGMKTPVLLGFVFHAFFTLTKWYGLFLFGFLVLFILYKRSSAIVINCNNYFP